MCPAGRIDPTTHRTMSERSYHGATSRFLRDIHVANLSATRLVRGGSHQTSSVSGGARCSSVVRVFAHGAMGRRIDPSWGEPTELFLFPASAPRLV